MTAPKLDSVAFDLNRLFVESEEAAFEAGQRELIEDVGLEFSHVLDRYRGKAIHYNLNATFTEWHVHGVGVVGCSGKSSNLAEAQAEARRVVDRKCIK